MTGYTPFHAITTNAGGDCGNFGNGLFVLGTPDNSITMLNQAFFKQDPNSTEVRRVTCRRMDSLLGKYAGCVLHAATAVASEQVTEAESLVRSKYGTSIFRLVGGDFNRTPTQSGMPVWIGSSGLFKDVDPLQTVTYPYTLTQSPHSKIDYALGDKSHFPFAPDATRDCNAANSDHCYLMGRMQF